MYSNRFKVNKLTKRGEVFMCYKMNNRIRTLLLIIIVSFKAQSATIKMVIHEDPSIGAGTIWSWASFDNHFDKCLVDTGARFSFVKRRNYPNYPALETGEQGVISGTPIQYDLIEIQKIQSDDFISTNHIVRAVKTNVPFNCLLGNDLFLEHSLRFDFSQNTITTDAIISKNSFPLIQYENKWIGFPVQINDIEYETFWDTGAGITLVDPEVIKQSPNNYTYVKDIPFNDPSGNHGSAPVYKMKSLKFGNYEITDTNVV